MAGDVKVGDAAPSSDIAVAVSVALARPKSSTLTWPPLVKAMFAGLRSRWTIAFHQLEDEEQGAPRFLDTVNGADVRVVQRGEDLSLAAKPGEPIGIDAERLRQNLQRDVASEPGIP